MAATAQTIVTAEVALAYPALSDRGLLLCLVGFYVGAVTAQTAVVAAQAAGYDALSDQQLDECLLAVLSP